MRSSVGVVGLLGLLGIVSVCGQLDGEPAEPRPPPTVPEEEDCTAVDCAPYGCDDPWCASCDAPQVYDSEVGCCGACVEPAPRVELWCPGSPQQLCRMLCAEPRACPDGQCNMREGTCCEASCQPYPEPECTGCCPDGAACFAPDPPCCAERSSSSGTGTSSSGPAAGGEAATACALGEDCGGQVNQDCGSACPPVCGEEQTMCSACPSAVAAFWPYERAPSAKRLVCACVQSRCAGPDSSVRSE